MPDLSDTPLGNTEIGWILGSVLLFIFGVVSVYIKCVIIPASTQRRELERKKADVDIELEKDKAKLDMQTKVSMAEAIQTFVRIAESIDKQLEQFGDLLKEIHNLTLHNIRDIKEVRDSLKQLLDK